MNAETIGPYQLREELGRGGMGVVYRAWDPRAGTDVAVKVLLRAGNERSVARFQTELEALRRLQHPNVVGVRDAGEDRGRPFLVMDYVPGPSLEEQLGRQGALEPWAAARLIQELARALEHAHQQGILHRDLKPANVILATDGAPRLTDFGLAKDLDATLNTPTLSGAFMGSPGYWPPEQASGDKSRIGPRSDVYGLGATLYAALTGRPPFDHKTVVDQVQATLKEPARPPSQHVPEIPPELDAICLRCLEKDPAARFPTAERLSIELGRFLAGGNQPPRRSSRPAIAISVVVAGAGVALALVVATGKRPALTPTPDASPLASASPEESASPEASATPEPIASPEPSASPTSPPDDSDVGQPAEPVEDDGDDSGLSSPAAIEAYAEGRAQRKARRYDEAIAAFRRSYELEPSGQTLNQLGLTQFDSGAHEEAIATYDRALRGRPGPRNLGALINRANAYQDVGRLEEARRDYRLALRYLPTEPVVWANLSAVSLKLGDVPNALEQADRALELDPDLSTAHVNRAQSLVKLARWAEAELEYRWMLRLHPESKLARRGVIVANSELRRHEVVVEQATRYLQVTPDDPRVLHVRGLSLLLLGDLERARADLERAIQLRPTNGRSHHFYGVVLKKQGHLEQALAAYDRACELLDPDPPDLRFSRGHALRLLKRLEQAVVDYLYVVELQPKVSGNHYWLGACLTQLERGAEALPHLDRALELGHQPESQPRAVRALSLSQAGRADEARAEAQRALSLNPPPIPSLLPLLRELASEGAAD